MHKETDIQMLGETETYAVWVSEEAEDDSLVYHLELGNITVHLFPDEWEEFMDLIRQAMR